MARYSCAALQTTARTAVRGPTLAVGTRDLALVEVSVEPTSVTPTIVALRIATTTGTSGTALDEVPWGGDRVAPAASMFQAPSTDHTAIAGFIRLAALPTAVGGGVIWTFGPEDLELVGGSGDAFFLSLPSGSDVPVNFGFDWTE